MTCILICSSNCNYVQTETCIAIGEERSREALFFRKLKQILTFHTSLNSGTSEVAIIDKVCQAYLFDFMSKSFDRKGCLMKKGKKDKSGFAKFDEL
jgi:hypothetical protein